MAVDLDNPGVRPAGGRAPAHLGAQHGCLLLGHADEDYPFVLG